MALPNSFELHVVPRARQENVGSNAAGDVSSLESEVSASMDATNTAVSGCSALAPADAATWATIYGGWSTFDQDLQACLQGVPSDQFAPPTVSCFMSYGLNWASAMTKLKSYQSQSAAWQARVHAACPSYNPLPVPNPQQAPATLGFFCRTFGWGCGGAPGAPVQTNWPEAIKYLAIVALVLTGAYYVGPLLLAGAAAGAGAIQRRE